MHKLSFSKEHKLPSDRYKVLLNKDPKKFFSRAFVFLYQYNSDLPHSYLGLAITKKKLRRANKRNFAKRINREAFRLHNQTLPKLELCILASKHAINLSDEQWQNCVEQFWNHIKHESQA